MVTGEMGTGFFNVYRQPWTKHVLITTTNDDDVITIKAIPIVKRGRVVDISYEEVSRYGNQISQMEEILNSSANLFKVEFGIDGEGYDPNKETACLFLATTPIGSHIFGVIIVLTGNVVEIDNDRFRLLTKDVAIEQRIVSEKDAPNIRIGVWPEGTHTQTFVRSEVIQRRQGVVRDFIKFVPNLPTWVPVIGGQEAWPWVFNIADSALVCGVIILLFTSSLGRKTPL